MKESWKEYKLDELLKIYNGKDHKFLKDGNIPVYGSGGIMRYVDKYLYDDDSILLPRKGTLDNIMFVKGKIWTVDTMYYSSVNLDLTDPYFLCCYLQQLKLEQLDTGSALPSMTQTIYYSVKVTLPSLSTQKRIASILSAYDDLIEVNNKRIKLLEQSARELYKEWFVRMRFPNYQHTKFNKGIPEGWEVKKIEDISNSQYGYTASSDDVGDAKFLRITDIVDNLINWEKVPFCSISQNNISKYSLKYGDILIARTGATVGYAKRINKGHPLSVFASYLVRLQLKDIDLNYFLGIIVDSEQYKEFIQTIASGAAQPNANASMLTSYSVLIPNKPLIIKFNNQISIIFDQIENLQKQNQELTEIRNRLLPRLISGKLEVKA